MDLRERLEAGELTAESARAAAVDHLETESPAPGQVVDWHLDALGASLSGANAEAVEASLFALVDGDRETAVATLRDRFGSVCERERPGLGDVEHPAACHLHADATARPDERLAADGDGVEDATTGSTPH